MRTLTSELDFLTARLTQVSFVGTRHSCSLKLKLMTNVGKSADVRSREQPAPDFGGENVKQQEQAGESAGNFHVGGHR